MTRPDLGSRLREFFRKVPVDQEVDEEFAFHVEMRARELIAGGVSPTEARATALRRFGDIEQVKRTCRDLGEQRDRRMRRAELSTELRQDVRYALRTLRKSPAFALIAVLTLALGIAANTAIFSVVDAVLLRPLPYADADRLVSIWNSYAEPQLPRAALSPADFADFSEQHAGFTAMSALADRNVNLTGHDEPQRLQSYVVSPNFFRVLGVRALLGRTFLDEEGVGGRDRVAVLSHDLWRRTFGADSGVVGRTIQLSGTPHTVVGVMPPGVRFPDAPSFLFPERAELWLPFSWERRRAEPRGDQFLRGIGRLGPGVTLERARQDLAVIAARLRAQYPDTYRAEYGWMPVLVPMREQILGDSRPALLVLLGAVAFVLLIACANVANLTLARGAGRRKEIALRTALGAGRARLVRQLLTESVVLSAMGGALGLLLAVWLVRVLARLGPEDIPRLANAGVDVRVLGFTLAVTLLTGIVFGLVPALQQSRTDVQGALKDGGRGASEGAPRHRLRGTLVVAEVALAVVVLVGAGLLLRSFVRLQRVDPGFDARGVLTMQLSLPRTRYEGESQVAAFYTRLLDRLATLPGVSSAGAVHPLPLGGDGWGASFLVEGQPVAAGEAFPHADFAAVTPHYFRSMGIPLVAGRVFTARDDAGAPPVVVVDASLARQYWPRENPIGKRLNLAGQPDSVWSTVVGVVGHVRSGTLQQAGEPQIYLSYFQDVRGTMSVTIRGSGDPMRLATSVRDVVRSLDADQPIAKMRVMDDIVARTTARQRFNLLLLSTFAASALLLAAVGIYGVTSYAVGQRTNEIGVRLALGALPGDVLSLVVGQGMRLVLLGVALGVAAALAVSRLMAGLLYGVGAADVATYVAIGALLSVVALLACYLPARRATHVDPATALRQS
jgi:predicted permease